MTDRERNEKTATEDSAKKFYTAATGTDDIQAELLRDFPESLKNRDFKIYLQPQYNYESGKVIGAEALVRWAHPTRGLIMPNSFISLLEQHGLIAQLDFFVWEEACSFIRKTIDSAADPIPISVNVSVVDLKQPGIVDIFVRLTEKYGIPVRLLQLEITESTYMENPTHISQLVSQLQQKGFNVEIDDFGSGYSSLNILKNIACDVLKLDMGFIENNIVGSRGGNILNSVVRMAHWLKTPVIAEGVETYEQAEYLKSIGCVFMQGYYFAKPMTLTDFEGHLDFDRENLVNAKYRKSNIENAERFWDISSQEALLFNSFVGGACITEYDNHHVEDIRVNTRFLELLGVSREEYAHFQTDIFTLFAGEKDRKAYIDMLEQGILTNSDTSCEIECIGIKSNETFWLEVRCRLLATNVNRHIFYCNIEDITSRKRLEQKNCALNEELLSLMDSVPGGILRFEISDEFRLTFVNKRAADIYGMSVNDIYNSFTERPFGFIHPDDKAAVINKFTEATERGCDSIDLECRRLTPNGAVNWIYFKARFIKKQNGVIFVTAIVMDVSDKKSAEESARARDLQLKKQYALQQSLFSSLDCGIMQYSLKDGKNSLINFNDRVWQIFGYQSRAEYDAATANKSKVLDTHPEDLQLVTEKIKMINGSTDKLSFDHRIVCKDGSIKWVHTTLEKVTMPDGSQIIQTVFSDITDQIKKEYDKYFKTVLSFFDEVYEVDSKANTITLCSSINERRDILNRPFTFSESINTWLTHSVLPEYHELVKHFCAGCSGQNKSIDQVEYKVKTLSGKTVWISSKRLHIFDERYFICNQDITAQKNREAADKQAALQAAISYEKRTEDEQSRLIAQISNGMLFSYDCTTGVIDFTARSASGEYLQLSSEDFLTNGLSNDLFIHPNDRGRLREAFAAAADGKTVSAFDFRSTFGSDDFRLWRINYTSIADDCGKIYRVIGYATDIHDDAVKKTLYTELRRSIPGAAEDLSETATLTSQIFHILYETADTEQAIEAVFAAIGKAFRVSRVYLFEDSPDHTHCSNTFEWCAPGISSEKTNLQNLSYDDDLGGCWHDNFDKRGLFYCPDISLLPKAQFDILSQQSIRSMLQCALMDGQTFMGYIGFDECTGTRKWSQEQVDTLHATSNVIGLFLLAHREKQSLTRLLHDYSVTVNDLQNLVNYLPGGVAKYRITDRAETVYFSDGIPALTGHTREEYEELYTKDAFEIIYPGDRERLSQSVQMCLSEGMTDIYYRIRHKNGNYVWVHLHGVFVHLPGSEPLFHAVFEGVSKQSQQYIDLLDQLSEAVYLIDAESHDIIFINNAARDLFHLSRDALQNGPCYRCLHGREIPCDHCRDDSGETMVNYGGQAFSAKYVAVDWSGRAAKAVFIKRIPEK